MRSPPSGVASTPAGAAVAAMSRRRPRETPLRRRSERSVPAARYSDWTASPGAMCVSWNKREQSLGTDRNFLRPDADRVADRIGDRRGRRHGGDLADADRSAHDVIEAALLEIGFDRRRVGDAGRAVVVEIDGQHAARTGIAFARLVKRMAEALIERARRLIARERRGGQPADGDARPRA